MKVLLYILLVIAALIGLLLITALFVPKSYTVEREVVVNKPKQAVYDYIKYLKNQDNYSKWNQLDPNMKKSYTGTDGTEGFSYAWDSDNKNAGKGSQDIVKLTEGERVDFAIHFIKPFKADATAYMTTTAVSDTQTKVKWGFNGNMTYPMNLMLVCMNMDKMVGDDLQVGLNNLKTLLEKQ
ncbi:MAG TPA: SRPBCC family protein [Chitinophaga sp.]|uniref:SRPBCC family protein n=1 Tax=Chitinophaga sp. TaxID=1869181 RepID=UPI002B7E35F7|nr:SRPBCC family protein [Chitinophaga sp.]HVI47716.1 SRPBCC family protein [Chitinophaga sp.]